MTFLNENKQFKTADEFWMWLITQPLPNWSVVGSTYHNTYIPSISDWRGYQTMLGMQTHYEQVNGWDRGPHLFVAKGTPDPLNDGIWVMTHPAQRGIHAGICNGDSDTPGRFGVEVVGDFNLIIPSKDHIDLVTSAIAMLHVWSNAGTSVNAHRDCMPGRTCPGQAFYNIKSSIASDVAGKIASFNVDVWDLWGSLYPLPSSQRGFGIPTAWLANMQGATTKRLGAARSWPTYSSNNVMQLFENGVIIYRNGSTRIILYSEFRVP